MKVLLLGGTGVIGKYLVDMFEGKGFYSFVTSRRPHYNYGNVCFIQGNAKDKIFLEKVCSMNKWDVIIDFMSYKTNEFKERVITLLNSTNQYLFISSARVYGDKEHPIRETSPRLLDYVDDDAFLSSDEYSLTKARQEDILINSGFKNYTIVRPCITYGPERMQLGVLEKEEWLFRALHSHHVIFCKELMDKVTTMTNGFDISRLLCAIAGNPKTYGEIYHLTINEHRTWRQLLELYKDIFKKITGKELKYKIIPLDDFLKCRCTKMKYQVIYDRCYNRDYDVTKESQLINMNDFIAPEVGLESCMKVFIENHRSFRNINWKFEGRKDRVSNEFYSLNMISGFKNKLKYLVGRFL